MTKKKRAAKKTSKSTLSHVNGLTCTDTGKKTKEGHSVYVDTKSNYWVHNAATGEVRKQ